MKLKFYFPGFSLTAHSVLRLFGSCPHLQCVGDLRYWSISFEDRREMFRQVICLLPENQIHLTNDEAQSILITLSFKDGR